MENLRTYANRLENALAEQTPFHTYNRDILHASQIVVAGFRHAQRSVYLLSNRLDPALYGDEHLLEAVRSFLKKDGAELRILLEAEIDAHHPFRRLAEDEFNGRVKIGIVPEGHQDSYRFNFMIVDDIGYRFEYDREKFEAIASFHEEGQRHMVSKLKNFFVELEKRAGDPEINSGGEAA